MAEKTYSGIVGNNETAIRSLMIAERMQKTGFREIATLIGQKYGVKVSHQTVKAYWVEVLDGEKLDGVASENESRALMDGGKVPVMMDGALERVQEIGVDAALSEMLEEITALCASNLQAYKEGSDRLRVELFKSLKDLKAMLKRG